MWPAEPHEVRAERLRFMRGYWRSVIVDITAAETGHTFTTFEPYLVQHKDTLGRELRQLLEELCAAEERAQERTEHLLEKCRLRCREIAIGFKLPSA